MRLWLRFLGGFIVFAALAGAATYLLIELREFLEEEFFSGRFPEFIFIIYALFALMITMIIMRFTIVKSSAEIMEIGMLKKERKKREKERKKRECAIEDP